MTGSHTSNTTPNSDRKIWRITIGNINSFPTGNNGTSLHKLEVFRNLVVGNNSDIILISEHNKNLKNTQQFEQPKHIVHGWWPKTITRTSYLTSNSRSTFEPGGTMIITSTRASSHTFQCGEDKYLLGRWNYISLKGKN
jgi:hypothetical protein